MRCAASVIGQFAGFLNAWQTIIKRQKNGRTQWGIECNQKRFLGKSVVVIIKISSPDVYRQGGCIEALEGLQNRIKKPAPSEEIRRWLVAGWRSVKIPSNTQFQENGTLCDRVSGQFAYFLTPDWR